MSTGNVRDMMNKRFATYLAATVLIGAVPALAQIAPPASVPLPIQRPGTPVAAAPHASAFQAPQTSPSAEITGSVIRPLNPNDMSAQVSASLKSGLEAISSNVATARKIRDGMRAGSLDRQILTWAIAMSGEKGVPSFEIAQASQELQGWPGLSALRAQSEKALFNENPPAAQVIAAFGATTPTTTEGAIALARAHLANGDRAQARAVIAGRWHSEAMDVNQENLVLRHFDSVLTVADHKRRMDMLLYRERVAQAERFASKGEAQSLFKARAAVIRSADNAGALINAVHASWHNDPSYLFARIEHLRQQDRYEEAVALLARVPNDPDALVDPDAWWNERRIIARGLLDKGDARAAYQVAAGHSAQSLVDRVDAEFHAGWFALRALNDARTAARHFNTILQVSSRPLSVSRAHYWLGRAAEAGGPGNAANHYALAAQHQTTYYGQLAAAKIGRTGINVSYPTPSDADRARFAANPAVVAIQRLENAGQERRAQSLYRALAEEMTSPGELALLAVMAERKGDHTTALRVGKWAYNRGVDVSALAFPIGAIPASANIASSGKALAYSIARQESEFNKAAVSPADARGLLQLLPGTAKGVAARHGLSYAPARLTQDAGYNATLGAHYLGEQISDFGGSYILTFIGYNAGPRRVPQWIERYGDPRGKSIEDVVDWVERIPFPETRNYVQRVMENYQVYKARLGAPTDIVADLRYGRR
jgi:soluble lytic murein transglycosylase